MHGATRRRQPGVVGGMGVLLAAASVAVFAACSSKNGAPTDLSLRLRPDSTCDNAPVACVHKLKVDLKDPGGSPLDAWDLTFSTTSGASSLGTVPNDGQGRFLVSGWATVAPPVAVFSGTSALVTFDPKADQVVNVTVSCPSIPNPCGIPTPVPTPTPPLFVSGTNANLVLGQPNFTSCSTNGFNSDATHYLSQTEGIFIDGNRVYVADWFNARLAVWRDKTTLTNGKAIDFVIGHTDTGITGSGSSGSNVFWQSARGVTVVDAHVIGTDQDGNRAEILPTPTPNGNGPGAKWAIGQSNGGNSGNRGTSTTRIRDPWGIAWSTTGGGLFLADTNNNRVLGYGADTAGFFKDNAAATLVLGQADFTSNAANRGAAVDGGGLNKPAHIAVDGRRLYVADTGNNRVLVWRDIATAMSGQAADFAIGQPDLATTTAVNPPTATSLNAPRGVAATRERLAIADSGNNRVLIWEPPPQNSTDPATQVLGQADFVTNTVNTGGAAGQCNGDTGVSNPSGGLCANAPRHPTASSLNNPGAAWFDGNDLWVSDSCNFRAVRFTAP